MLQVRVAELASARHFASQPTHFDERQQEILLVDGEQHVEPFGAAHTKILALIV